MPKQNDSTAFDFFQSSERITSLIEKYGKTSIPFLIKNAKEGDSDAILYLLSQTLPAIRSGYLANKDFSGDDHSFFSKFLKKILAENRQQRGPFYTSDIVDTSREDQIEQIGIEVYILAKTLTQSEEVGSPFPDTQEVHPLENEKGLFKEIGRLYPEYYKILKLMVNYTPSDVICEELGIPSIGTLKSKIRSIQKIVNHYLKQEDRNEDDFFLAK